MSAQSSPTDTPAIPQNNPNWSAAFNKAFQEWEAENAKYGADYSNLQKMIEKMLNEMKTGHTEQAFQMAQMDVLPGATQVQGDSMGQLAGSMNLASALQESMTNAENQANIGKGVNINDAWKFVTSLQHLYDEIKADLALPKDKQWMGASTAKNILDAIGQICKPFGSTNPNQINGDTVQSLLKLWSENPTTKVGNKTGQQWIQDLQQGITQSTNGISSQSQGLQAQEQFAANTFTQYLNVCKGIFQATEKQYQSFVQNQKG